MSSTGFHRTFPGMATCVDTMELTHSNASTLGLGALLARGPQIVEATAGGPLRTVKPFTPEVRANIDYELARISTVIRLTTDRPTLSTRRSAGASRSTRGRV